MAIIKNLDRLKLSNEAIAKIEAGAEKFRRKVNVTFNIKENSESHIIIQLVRGKNSAGKYYHQKELIKIGHETFDLLFPDKKVHIHAICYNDSPVNKVNPKWINEKMMETGTKL